MRKVRGKDISMIFQDPMTSLSPVLKIVRQMREVLQLHLNMSKEEAHEHAFKMLRSVVIPRPESIIVDYPHQLFGVMMLKVINVMKLLCIQYIVIIIE